MGTTERIETLILCGGMGTRLREETEYRPKPMVEIGGRPILWHIMKGYASSGFTDFVICLGYKGEQIKEYFLNYEAMNNDFTVELGRPHPVTYYDSHCESGWRVTLADTGIETMTGARMGCPLPPCFPDAVAKDFRPALRAKYCRAASCYNEGTDGSGSASKSFCRSRSPSRTLVSSDLRP